MPGAVEWSANGRTVVKRARDLSHYWPEVRANRGLSRRRPPVAAPRLVATNRARRELVFEAVDGTVLGPKYPTDLPPGDVDTLVGVARRMATYRPRVPRPSRTPLLAMSWVGDAARERLRRFARDHPPAWSYAHGDITARNVIRRTDGVPVLIDWEWAGLYPLGWELAFVWYCLLDTPGARARVESVVPPADEPWFWRSAAVIAEVHVGFDLPPEFRPNHEASLDLALRRVATASSPPGRGGTAP